MKGTAELAIDVVDDTRPDCAFVLIGGDDLVDHAGEGSGFIDGEEAPGTSVRVAGDASSGGGSGGKRGLQKGTPVESEARLHVETLPGL